MFPSTRQAVAALVLLSLYPATALAGPLVCGTKQAQETEATAAKFYPYRSGVRDQDLRFRDLEFLWDSLYATVGITDSVRLTLDNFAATLDVLQSHNPLGIPTSEFQLVYDYFRTEDHPYSNNATNFSAVVIGRGTGIENYASEDRSHSDVYIWNPTRDVRNGGSFVGGEFPSPFTSDEEDVSTGHSVGDIKPLNALGIKGPASSQMLDVNGTGWTRPDAGYARGFAHEFQHSLPQSSAGMYGEMFSAGAEILSGYHDTSGSFDLPYTVSTFGADGACHSNCSEICGKVRVLLDNYTQRTAFMAYLAYNFRGANTSATLSASEDDLMRRWSYGDRTLRGLRGLLNDTDCGDCPNFFGASLDGRDRLSLLHHNFRVASYVNNTMIGEGQYGFPAQWMRRLIEVRKTSAAFSSGDITFLKPANHRVLAYVRTLGEESILIVNNLSATAQAVELDMSAWEGAIPVEMFGGSIFPRIGELPYMLTLSPYDFFWFRLRWL